MSGRGARLSAVLALVIVLAGLALCFVNGRPELAVATVGTVAFPLVALVIFRRQPSNAVARVFVVAGTLLGIERTSEQLAVLGTRLKWSETAVHAVVWPQTWAWFPGLFLLITVGLLRFPDGRLPTRSWRWVERVAVGSMAVWSLGIGAATLTVPAPELMTDAAPAPTGFAGIAFIVGEAMFFFAGAAALCSLASLIVRYRRSGPVARSQIRWVLYAAAVAIATEIGVDAYGTLGDPPEWVQSLGEGIGFTLIAVATAVAITRYRLYEIDRLVSRTLTYTLVLALLVGLYLAVVLGLANLVPADLGPVWVAAATLLVSVVAVPLTRRVRRAVERRFDRARVDAQRVAVAFAARLRARPDVGDIPSELVGVVAAALAPAHAGVWLRERTT